MLIFAEVEQFALEVFDTNAGESVDYGSALYSFLTRLRQPGRTFTVGLGTLILETNGTAWVKSARTVPIVIEAVWVESAGSEGRSGSIGWHRSSVRRINIVDWVRVVRLYVSAYPSL
jgi:hypothetical protein